MFDSRSQFPRPGSGPKTVVGLSLTPFAAKLETWLRAAGAKYVNDFEYPMSPETGKCPWITLNGEDISDSQVIVETLMKRPGIGRELG